MTLIERLVKLADLWAAAQGRSVSRLSTIVANDGKAIDRLRDGSKTCTVAMFERFLAFFREPGNWPEGGIPAEAAAILDEVEAIATAGAADGEIQISSHDLMSAPPAAGDRAEWPFASATNGAGNITSGSDVISEADSLGLFPEGGEASPPTSSSTCPSSGAPASPAPCPSSTGPADSEAEAA